MVMGVMVTLSKPSTRSTCPVPCSVVGQGLKLALVSQLVIFMTGPFHNHTVSLVKIEARTIERVCRRTGVTAEGERCSVAASRDEIMADM